MTSSPGSTVAIIAAIIPSVDPHVTVISVSGSTSKPRCHSVLRAIASRKSFEPHVIAYWFTSLAIASIALRLISSGAAKSGKPCDRLTALYFSDSRVISRITDSVNDFAFFETRRLSVAGVVICSCPALEKCINERKTYALTGVLLWQARLTQTLLYCDL